MKFNWVYALAGFIISLGLASFAGAVLLLINGMTEYGLYAAGLTIVCATIMAGLSEN